MKLVAWLLSAVDVWFGFRAFLNAIHVLQTSKYSQTATALFALLFLTLGAAGFYLAIAKQNPKLGALIAIAPWVLGLIMLLMTMATAKYQ